MTKKQNKKKVVAYIIVFCILVFINVFIIYKSFFSSPDKESETALSDDIAIETAPIEKNIESVEPENNSILEKNDSVDMFDLSVLSNFKFKNLNDIKKNEVKYKVGNSRPFDDFE